MGSRFDDTSPDYRDAFFISDNAGDDDVFRRFCLTCLRNDNDVIPIDAIGITRLGKNDRHHFIDSSARDGRRNILGYIEL